MTISIKIGLITDLKSSKIYLGNDHKSCLSENEISNILAFKEDVLPPSGNSSVYFDKNFVPNW